MSPQLPISHMLSPSMSSSQSSLNRAFKNLQQQNSGLIRKSVILSASMFTTDFYDRQVIEKQLKTCPDEITFEKFTEIFEQAQVFKEDTSNPWIFKLYDKENKGYIDRNDLIKASQITGVELSEQEIAEMLKAENPLVDGKVYYDDFVQIMSTPIEFQ